MVCIYVRWIAGEIRLVSSAGDKTTNGCKLDSIKISVALYTHVKVSLSNIKILFSNMVRKNILKSSNEALQKLNINALWFFLTEHFF